MVEKSSQKCVQMKETRGSRAELWATPSLGGQRDEGKSAMETGKEWPVSRRQRRI